MNDNQITALIIEIKSSLASILAKVENVQAVLNNHESRIQQIEHDSPKKEDYKTELLKLLGKGILIALLTIGSLTGASGLIAQILGK